MTDTRNNGGPAFPQHDLSGYGIGPKMDGDRYMVDGMSLRDWFAGQALPQAIQFEMSDGGSYQHFCPQSVKIIAEHAYEMADAMLEARSLATRSSSKEA